jgi:hypothetical protein
LFLRFHESNYQFLFIDSDKVIFFQHRRKRGGE